MSISGPVTGDAPPERESRRATWVAIAWVIVTTVVGLFVWLVYAMGVTVDACGGMDFFGPVVKAEGGSFESVWAAAAVVGALWLATCILGWRSRRRLAVRLLSFVALLTVALAVLAWAVAPVVWGPAACVQSGGEAPAWSPDGRQIAFASERDGNYDVYVMNADGSDRRRLTRDPAFDGFPAWSPDGHRVAFDSRRAGNHEIYVMNADGSDKRRLTRDRAFDGFPAWSPDGHRIAFDSRRAGNHEIYVMNADGSHRRRLTHNAAADSDPAWSPDGRMIAFDRERADCAEVYVMNADGSRTRRLTRSSTNAQPAWSPRGRIAFASDRDSQGFGAAMVAAIFDAAPAELYVMNADGTHVRRLSRPGGTEDFNGDPAWSPDGRTIAFASDRSGILEVYVMNADGSHLRRLTR